MAIPGVPLAALVALLFVVTLAEAPFASARAAIFPDVLTGDTYVVGTAVTLTTYQFAQVLGFAVGGAVVGFFGTRTSLVIDAVTFAAVGAHRPRLGAPAARAGGRQRSARVVAAGRHLRRRPARPGPPGPAHADAVRPAGRVLQRSARGWPPHSPTLSAAVPPPSA